MSQENVEIVRKSIDACQSGRHGCLVGFPPAQRSYGSPCPSLGLETSTADGVEAREWRELLLEVFVEARLEIEEIADPGAMTGSSSDTPRSGRGRGSGLPGEQPSWAVFWLADGLIARRQILWTRDEALEAAGLSE